MTRSQSIMAGGEGYKKHKFHSFEGCGWGLDGSNLGVLLKRGGTMGTGGNKVGKIYRGRKEKKVGEKERENGGF